MQASLIENIESGVLEHLQTLRLLCVEDDEEIRLSYKVLFEVFFKEVIFAQDGQDGYEKYLANDIDVVISDYNMPVLNGLDMIKQIRELNKEIPIILITAITDTNMIITALRYNVNNFIQKPLDFTELTNAIVSASKLIIANNYLEEQRNLKIKELEIKEEYHNYQEDLAFAKELNILRNDFYYKMIDVGCNALIDFLYQPLDILSGDSYSARQIDDEKTFYLIVDGMGKGLSASLSSMLVTSYINHTIDKMQKLNKFSLGTLIYESLEYIKPILLEEEALSLSYIILDCKNAKMEYATFAMPSILMQTTDEKVVRLKSNNIPVSRYTTSYNISFYETSDIVKFLFYSDGMVENTTRFESKLYSEYIESDFLQSFTKNDMREKFNWKIGVQEDDITFIFINKLNFKDTTIANEIFGSSLEEIDRANGWYTEVWNTLSDNMQLLNEANVVFTEMLMNAFEHGNLGITASEKNKLLENDVYFDTLKEMQKECDKKIEVNISKIKHHDTAYIVTQIKDEGCGFDTKILSKVFRNARTFNGRGVFVSRNSSLGIYYNHIGNSVVFLHKI
jgi:CheY-like chemotaxis protein